jgi:hypothetical protein
LARVFWSHLRSFVTTMKPKHSLNHNIKSVPLVLTGNSGEYLRFIGREISFQTAMKKMV